MAYPVFGIGILTLTPSSANPTPARLGIIKDVSLDIGGDPVELYGEKQFPMDVAIGKRTIGGKGKFANYSADIVATALSVSTTTGSRIGIIDEAGTPTANTLTVTNGATFAEDLGVIRVSTGLPMVRVASGPATGQYSVNTTTGVYTFAAGDSNPPCLFSYTYTGAAAGKTATVTNTLMGAATTYGLNLHNTYKTKNIGVRLPAIVVPKLSFGFKNEGHSEFDFEFKAFADASGNVAYFTGTE